MQIDSTPLDIAVEFEDGITGRVELTALVDVATRSIPAAVLRPSTKAVDAALLLARCVARNRCAPDGPKRYPCPLRHSPTAPGVSSAG